MANQIILKKSSVVSKVPATGDLAYGELALNYADGKLYYKRSDNIIDAFAVASNFALASHTHDYLPLSGGTLTGVLTTPNGTHGIVIGDDSRLADRNVANTLFVEGAQNTDRGYINFSATTGNSLGAIAGGALTWNGSTIWHAGNDGSGSGLDADTLDGNHASAFATASHTHSYLPLSGGTLTGVVTFAASQTWPTLNQNTSGTSSGISSTSPQLAAAVESNSIYISSPTYTNGQITKPLIFDWYSNYWSIGNIRGGSTDSLGFGIGFKDNTPIHIFTSTAHTINGNSVWHAGNDGADSGLDADLLDGNHASAFYLATNPSGYTTNTGTVTSIATSSPLTGGTITTTGTIGIQVANSTQSGYLTSTDWNTFNNKQPAGSYLTAESDTLASVTSRGKVATDHLNLPSGEGNGFCFWNDTTNYKIHMGVTAGTYQYGPVTDYSMRFTMGGGTGRGFTWGYAGSAPIASLNASTGNMQIAGSFYAASKSFLIEHPTQPGKKLVHGSLEGPEHGVYVRGKVKGNIIELPEYWTKLVDPDSITVQLTPIGIHQRLYVEDIRDNKVYIGNSGKGASIHCFFYVQAERVDVDKLQVEVE